MSAIVARGLQKRYRNVTALAGLDLEVKRGEVFGFLGPNGAGKTTFTKLATGFIRPTAGSLEVMGLSVQDNPVEVARIVGLVPDQYDFYGNMSAREHLDFYGRLHGMDRRQRKDRIAEVLAAVRMEERADTKVRTYSHGMKQRICIAQALLNEPQLIIFDEPTNGLDPAGAFEMRQLLKKQAKSGATVFLNSHQLHEVEDICQRVAIINKGKLLALESVATLRARGGAAVVVHLENPSAAILAAAQQFAAAPIGTAENTLTCAVQDERIPDLVAAIVGAGGRITEVQRQQASLEAAFLAITGGESRDAAGPWRPVGGKQ